MSAFIVSKDHIDAILTFASKKRMSVVLVKNSGFVAIADHLDLVGEVLWKENHKSVNFKYGERERTPKYTFTEFKKQEVSLPAFIKLINCLEYQSLEHMAWDKSLACKILISLVNQGARLVDGYDDAPWDI